MKKENIEYVRSDEAAKLLETSEYYTDMLVNAGKLRGYTLMGRVYVLLDDIKARVNNR